MTKRAFLFAGQGAQKVGMARDFYEAVPEVKVLFDQAEELLGYDLRQLIDTDEEKLNQTWYTQPAILTTSVAIYNVLQKQGIRPDMVAGLSLGEYSALVAAGAISFENALQLVAKRGQLMEEAVPAGYGKMVAVLNTEATLIEEVCQVASLVGVVSPANYNTPGQIVIGGDIKAVNHALELLKEKGIKRLIPLNVSGPFHTALLEPASYRLGQELEKIDFKEFEIPLIGNTEADIMTRERIPELLARQVMEPVRFYESIKKLQELGCEEIIEIGPGSVLSAFIKKIDKSLKCTSISDMTALRLYLQEKEGK